MTFLFLHIVPVHAFTLKLTFSYPILIAFLYETLFHLMDMAEAMKMVQLYCTSPMPCHAYKVMHTQKKMKQLISHLFSLKYIILSFHV